MKFIEQSLEKHFLRKHEKIIRPFFKERDPFYVALHSMDALHLHTHPHVKDKIVEYTLAWGAGHSHRRILDKLQEREEMLENRLSLALGVETILFLPTYQKSLARIFKQISSLPIITTSHMIATDEEIPYRKVPSFLDDSLASQAVEPVIHYMQTVDPLDEARHTLWEFCYLSKELRGFTVVDDLYTFTSRGKDGFGHAALKANADLLIGGFPQDIGVFCAFLGISHKLKEYLLHTLPDLFRFSLLTPPLIGAMEAYLDLIPHFERQREELVEIETYFALQTRELPLVQKYHLFLLPLHTPAAAKALQSRLYRANISTTIARFGDPSLPQYYLKGYLHHTLEPQIINEFAALLKQFYTHSEMAHFY
ncbi:MAG: hypothetical protein A3F09_05735 [Chlamydiae bacterium RIFCSPHIGHO2_12_FULL_49_11]|nr:MAG: hypothetical protein A3F09_05735 [Chlamydiae bacterium RIFCSPHIGHO2_12_FULL_49_11]